MKKNEIDGYIIQNETGLYLSRDHHWVEHASPEEAFIHAVDALLAIALLAETDTWKEKPSAVIPGYFDNYANTVVVTGEKRLLSKEVKKLTDRKPTEDENEDAEIVSAEEIEKLLNGETVVVSTSLESSDGNPITLECYIIPSEYPRKWILITAIANQVAIGFVDARYFPESQRGVVESQHFSRSGAHNAPHSKIRYRSGDDGFYVEEKERGRKVGQAIFDTLKAVLRGLGTTSMSVEQPKKRSESFYERNGGKRHMSGFFFNL